MKWIKKQIFWKEISFLIPWKASNTIILAGNQFGYIRPLGALGLVSWDEIWIAYQERPVNVYVCEWKAAC